MKKSRFCVLGVVMFQLLVFSVSAQEASRSYFVRANGDDLSNNGRSEEAPFKTLAKAIEMSARGVVKTITVIGTLDAETRVVDSSAAEITIRGKPGAVDEEAAILKNGRDTIVTIFGNSNIRFEDIELTQSGQGLNVEGPQAIVTLGKGAKITNCSWTGIRAGDTNSDIQYLRQQDVYGTAVLLQDRATLIMEADALISGNVDHAIGGFERFGFGGGVYVNASTLIMKDTASITGNVSDVGGGVYVKGRRINTVEGYKFFGSLIMQGNSVIADNTAKWGGGVFTEGNLTLQDNARVAGNTAEYGGGICRVLGEFILKGTSQVSGNKASESGGGIFAGAIIIGNIIYSPVGEEVFTIQDNAKVTHNTGKLGGGVFMSGGKMAFTGGEISENRAEYGAGLYTDVYKNMFRGGRAEVNVTGGTITGNEAEFVGGGVYRATGSAFSRTASARITANMAGDGDGLDIFLQE